MSAVNVSIRRVMFLKLPSGNREFRTPRLVNTVTVSSAAEMQIENNCLCRRWVLAEMFPRPMTAEPKTVRRKKELTSAVTSDVVGPISVTPIMPLLSVALGRIPMK